MASKETKEVVTSDGEIIEVERDMNLPARPQASGVLIGGAEYDVVGLVNVPTLKHETFQTVAVKIIQPIVQGMNEITEEALVDGVKREVTRQVPINVARVINLTDGQVYELVLNAISADSFETGYPDKSYVGKSFAIKKLDVVKGKRYKDVQIFEIQPRA